MKVAFATDDKVTISRMTGRAKLFAIYTIEDGEVKDIEYIPNDHDHGHDHSHGEHDHHHGHDHSGHSHKQIISELASRDVLFVTRHLGKHFKEGVIELGVNYKMTKTEKIEDALKEL